jgi:exodeoxyribonuclease VII small subunit
MEHILAAKRVADSKRKFDELLLELETVVEKLEGQEPDLEAAISGFERGMELSGECHKRLDQAEQKVKLLQEKSSGVVDEVDFVDS